MKKIVVFLFLFFVFIASRASAQVFIEQGKINLTVHPGEKINDVVTVNNTSNKEVKVKIYWEDFSYQSPFEGTKKFSPAGTSADSLARWIEFSPHDFVLLPFAKNNISYTLNVPEDAKGGYYGVLFVEPENKELSGDKGVKIITRVGCLFFVETADRVKRASAEELAFDGCRLTGKLRNESNVIILPQATYYVMDREGGVVDRGELKKYYIPPGEVADIDVAPNDLNIGDYTLVLTIDLQDGDVVVKEIDFTKNSDIDCRLNAVRD